MKESTQVWTLLVKSIDSRCTKTWHAHIAFLYIQGNSIDAIPWLTYETPIVA